MGSTRQLSEFVSTVKFDDLPEKVVEQSKIAIIDCVGNIIGGSRFPLMKPFIDLSLENGGGSKCATLFGARKKVSIPFAAFGNCTQETLLDFSDSIQSPSRRMPIWPAALAVPAAMAAIEAKSASGRDLLTSTVAGYECASRIIKSMDMSKEGANELQGATTSLFAAVASAGRALALNPDQMTSAIGMAGIYTPVSAGYKWWGDTGLIPRKDIKQGWGWMCFTGSFAAVSASKGLEMTQENNILDGAKGLWRMLGMDSFNEESLTKDLGLKYHIEEFATKKLPGCIYTHSSIVGATELVAEHSIDLSKVERIDIITNSAENVGFDEPDPQNLSGKQFNVPYQVSAALTAGSPGPNWYSDEVCSLPLRRFLAERISLSFDDECEAALRDNRARMCKIRIMMNSGEIYLAKVDDAPRIRTKDEVKTKFLTTVSQVVPEGRGEEILKEIDSLPERENIDSLVALIAST